MNKTLVKLLLYATAITLLFLMIRLGFWQLSRAEEKQIIQNFVVEQNTKEIDLGKTLVSIDNLYQQAFGVGEYIHDQGILIDSQVSEGKVGYHIVTPFRLEKNGRIILVNSGWIPVGVSRKIKPKVSLPEGRLNVSGRLQKPHAKPPIWKDETPLVQDGAWQYLSIEEFMKRSNLTVSPLILELEPNLVGVGGYERKWRVYDDTWINRHKAYALQWFSMAFVFTLMCLVLEFRSRRKLS